MAQILYMHFLKESNLLLQETYTLEMFEDFVKHYLLKRERNQLSEKTPSFIWPVVEEGSIYFTLWNNHL